MRYSISAGVLLAVGVCSSRADTIDFTQMGSNETGWITRSDTHADEHVYSGQIDITDNGSALIPTYCITTNRNISVGNTWSASFFSGVDSSWWGGHQSGFPQPGFNDFAYLVDNYNDVAGKATLWSATDPTGHNNTYTANDVAAALQLAVWEYSDPNAVYTTSGHPSNELFTVTVRQLTDWMFADAGTNAGANDWLLDVYQPTDAASGGSAQTLITPHGGGHSRFLTPEPVSTSLSLAAVGLFVRRRTRVRASRPGPQSY